MSRRRKNPSGNPARVVSSTGLKIEARHKHHATLPQPTPGRHMWVVTGAWVITDPTADQLQLDTENLMTIEGPGCFVCEETYTPAMAAKPCPGEPPTPRFG